MSEPRAERKTGKVKQLLGDYGFIKCDEITDQDLYFKLSWFRGASPQVGEVVTFEVKNFSGNLQAHYPRHADDESAARDGDRVARSDHLLDWAYLGYLPNVLSELKGLALNERWEFKNAPRDANRPYPILFSYLLHTFQRLILEGKKVVVNESAGVAAFNTGLVDPRYEPIYALFTRSESREGEQRRPNLALDGFCIAGEGAEGQKLVRFFSPLPAQAHYFDQPVHLLYDTRSGKPELDWEHIVIERIDRYPKVFLEDNWPPSFQAKDVSQLDEKSRKQYYVQLGQAIKDDNRTYRRIMNRVKDAVDLCIKRVSWNFKTAVPQYYPREKSLQLLLPLCLVSDEQVDLALTVERTESGNYLGHTVLSLDWAYKNARLICRPDSDWLQPLEIEEESLGEDES
jgi:hypothetical protein